MAAYPNPPFHRITNSTQHNVYSRPDMSATDHCSGSPSRRLLFSMRDRMNIRIRRDSANASSIETEMLDEDLGFPPTCDEPPPGFTPCTPYGHSLQSDSAFFSNDFRSRSRSDAACYKSHSPRKIGTLVLFPTSAANCDGYTPSRNFNFEGRPCRRKGGLRHTSVCMGDFPTNCNYTPSPTNVMSDGPVLSHHNPLFVDTSLANRNFTSIPFVGIEESSEEKPAPISSRLRSSSVQSSSPVHMQNPMCHSASSADSPHVTCCSPIRVSRSLQCSSSRFGRCPGFAVHNQLSLDSGLDSSFSNCAILIRENNLLNASHDGPSTFSPGAGGFCSDHINKIIFESQDGVYAVFMRAHSCYDLIPVSSKLVVFDTELPVRKAFFALIYNGVRAAPLWNNEKKEFVGMLTITDFIQVLSRYHKNGCTEDGIKELEEHKITTWRKVLEEDGNIRPFVTIDPSENLYHAVEVLCKSRVHRLPLMERNSGDISYILTHKRLIRFLYLYITDLPRPSFMSKTPRELGIGTWKDVLTISMDTPLIDALHVFLEKRVSALPLLDRDGKVVDIFAKFDVINLAAEKIYTNLNMNVRDALKHRSDWFEGVRTCMEDDSLMTVVEIIVKAEVHRLVVTDVDRKVKGIISLSDILRALVLNPPVSEDIDDGGECEQDVAGMEES
ncbi:hypothetical protein AB6A40_003835 [Gnathostoma spinigerum]|uniref:CBS domain-containing protein n=1 Tax=Gnathostoma spinigerum TaxID=75299 RepID=A0ABD6EIB5_9BILA